MLNSVGFASMTLWWSRLPFRRCY